MTPAQDRKAWPRSPVRLQITVSRSFVAARATIARTDEEVAAGFFRPDMSTPALLEEYSSRGGILIFLGCQS